MLNKRSKIFFWICDRIVKTIKQKYNIIKLVRHVGIIKCINLSKILLFHYFLIRLKY